MFVFWPDEENGSLSLYPVNNPTIPPGVHVFIRNGPLFPAQNVCEKTYIKNAPGLNRGVLLAFLYISHTRYALSHVSVLRTQSQLV